MLSFLWRRVAGCGLVLALVACGPAATSPTVGDDTLPTANAEGVVLVTPTLTLPNDVPMLENALGLKVNSSSTDISYRVVGTFEDVVKFYQAELLTLGWEQKSKKDTGFATNITLLRFKSDASLSVTIQAVAGTDEVSIRITRLPK